MKKNEIEEIYSDGIGKIHFLGGTIRLDLFSFEPTDDDKSQPEPVITKRIVMSPNAFLASYESFVNMIDKLQAAGIISKTSGNESNESSQNAPENHEDNVKVEEVAAAANPAEEKAAE